ncbi:hypothetical protein KBD87_02495 [Candidatus Saccharibacteria bacterium]|nr:hypothetical protein [Candidatus Saccharibacteria bacterium]
MTQLNTIGSQFAGALAHAHAQSTAKAQQNVDDQKVHVVGAGATITAAYEQLRNAAEYTEEHVLLQRAVRRFFKRLFMLRDKKRLDTSGEELLIELTQAGYVANDSVSEITMQSISDLATAYYDVYERLEKAKGLTTSQIEQWSYELLAVEIDWLLHDASYLQTLTQFAHTYFLETLDIQKLLGSKAGNVETALYVAIHRTLLKSDEAVIRLGLLRRYQQSPKQLTQYIQTNKQIDELFTSAVTEKLYHLVDRRSAHLRVLQHMVDADPSLPQLLENRDQFLVVFEKQISDDYRTVNKKVNHGIIRSVIFLVITKFIIGIGIEVPYDYVISGQVLWTPLLINLLFPPLYMVLLRTTLMMPGAANTARLVKQIDDALYEKEPKLELSRRLSQQFSASYNVAYGFIFMLVFGSVAWLLWRFFSFDLVHLSVFFVFLSGASFLGFRLSRMIRELESIDSTQTGVTVVRDFLYMPFVVVGRYISDKYAKINLVALVLDMLIELPLKTILRLVRQWSAFISAKKDQL